MATVQSVHDIPMVRPHAPTSAELNRIFVRLVSPLTGTRAVLDIPQTKKTSFHSLHSGTIVSVHTHGLRFRVEIPVSQERLAPLTPGYTMFVAWTDLWATERRTVVQEGRLLEAVRRAHELIAHPTIEPFPRTLPHPWRALLGGHH